jgi:gluconokinase
VIVIMGVAGSGKTTVGRALADALGWAFVDADDFHPPASRAKMAAGLGLDEPDRAPWLAALRAEIERRQAAGKPTVLACSALRAAYREALAAGDPHVRFVHLVAPPEVLAARLAAREGHFAGRALLESQLETLEAPGEEVATLDATRAVPELVGEIRARLAL